MQTNISAARTDVYLVRPGLDHPLLGDDVPNTEVASSQLERSGRRLSRCESKLLKSAELLGRAVRDTQVQLGDFFASDGADILHLDVDLGHLRPQRGGVTPALAQRGKGLDADGVVLKLGVAQAVTEFESGSDVVLVKGAVIQVDAFGEVTLWVCVTIMRKTTGLVDRVVLLTLGNGVWQLAREVGFTVQELDEGCTTVLAGEVSENSSSNVGMVNPFVDEANTCCVNDDNGVTALGCDIENQVVGFVVVETLAVPAFSGHRIDEDETGVSSGVDIRVVGLEIPVDPGVILDGSLLNGIQGLSC